MCEAIVKLSQNNMKFHEIFEVTKGRNFENITGKVTDLHMEKEHVSVRSCFKFDVDM